MSSLRAFASAGAYPNGCPNDITPGEWRTLMWSALCHDLGKPEKTTKDDGRIIAHGHDKAGEEPTRSFMARLTENGFTEDIVALTVNHHRLADVTRNNASDKAWRKLKRDYKGFRLEAAALLSRADWAGSAVWGDRPVLDDAGEHKVATVVWEKAPTIVDRHAAQGPKPIIGGDDLIAAGMRPGPLFKVALEAAALKQQQGETNKDALLRAALEVDHV